MMKKRNIAIAMAAVTTAGTVAPVFASSATTTTPEYTINVKDAGKLVSKVRELLSDANKYDTKGKENIYSVYTNYKIVKGNPEAPKEEDKKDKLEEVKGKGYEIKSATDLVNIVSLVKGENLKVTIVDNGHAIVDGKKVDKVVPKYEDVVTLSEVYNSMPGVLKGKEAEDALKNLNATPVTTAKFDKKTGEINVDVVYDIEYNTSDENIKDINAVKKYIEERKIADVKVEEVTVNKTLEEVNNSAAEMIEIETGVFVTGLTEGKEYITSTPKDHNGILNKIIEIPAGYSLEVLRDGVKEKIKPDCKYVNFAEGEHGEYQFKL